MLLLGVCHANLQQDRKVSEQEGDQMTPFSGNRHNHIILPSSSLSQKGNIWMGYGVGGFAMLVLAVVLPILVFVGWLLAFLDKFENFKLGWAPKIIIPILIVGYFYLQVSAASAFDPKEPFPYARADCDLLPLGMLWLDCIVFWICVIIGIFGVICACAMN
jgi:hypothetical protein